MSNHYHLFVETPAGSLVAGMRWFQTTWNRMWAKSSADTDQGHGETLLKAALARLELEIEQMRALKKDDPRKQGVAWLLKSRTVAGNQWICQVLRMGDRSNVNRAMRRFDLARDRESKRLERILRQCPDPHAAPKPTE